MRRAGRAFGVDHELLTAAFVTRRRLGRLNYVIHASAITLMLPTLLQPRESRTLTTTVFSQRSLRWFDAFPRRATPKGQKPSSSAQHRIKGATFIHLTLRARGAPAVVLGRVSQG